MTLSEQLALAWATLEAGEDRETLTRSLRDFSLAANVSLGVTSDQARELRFDLPASGPDPRAPKVHGIRVFIQKSQHANAIRRTLVLRCIDRDSFRVFSLFAADILQQSSGLKDPMPKIVEVLSAWREMFRRLAAESADYIRGVVGELHELDILCHYSVAALESWQGPNQRPRDFERGSVALEIKSSGSYTASVEIHGLQQLWARQLDVLVLGVKHVQTDADGMCVADLVGSLLLRGVDSTLLQDKLDQLDVTKDKLQEMNAHKFKFSSTRYYLIKEDSPVLTPDSIKGESLPSSVLRVRYDLDLSALTPCPANTLIRLRQRLAGA